MPDLTDTATVMAAIFAGGAIVQASLLQKKALQPYVVVALTRNASVPAVIEVSIKNYGQTAARDVRASTHVTPMRPGHAHKGEFTAQPLKLPFEIAQLGPGEEWTTVWGHLSQLTKINTRKEFWGEVKYVGQGRNWWLLGLRRKRHRNEFPFDLKAFDERTHIDGVTLESIGAEVEKIRKHLIPPKSFQVASAAPHPGTPESEPPVRARRRWIPWPITGRGSRPAR